MYFAVITELLFVLQTCVNPLIYARSIPSFSTAVKHGLGFKSKASVHKSVDLLSAKSTMEMAKIKLSK